MLMGDAADLKLVTRVFEQCCQIKSNDMVRIIKSAPLGGQFVTVTGASSNLVNASNKFIKSLSEQLIVFYCALNESIANKS